MRLCRLFQHLRMVRLLLLQFLLPQHPTLSPPPPLHQPRSCCHHHRCCCCYRCRCLCRWSVLLLRRLLPDAKGL